MSNGPSTASIANLQKFLDTYVCQANTNGTAGYFYFEAFDEVWKVSQRWAMCQKYTYLFSRRTKFTVAWKVIGVFSTRSESFSWFVLFFQEISPFSYFSKSLKDITIPTCSS